VRNAVRKRLERITCEPHHPGEVFISQETGGKSGENGKNGEKSMTYATIHPKTKNGENGEKSGMISPFWAGAISWLFGWIYAFNLR
jgi:hypothetical protein